MGTRATGTARTSTNGSATTTASPNCPNGAPEVRTLARDTEQTHVLFNNCYRDNAPVKAQQLTQLRSE